MRQVRGTRVTIHHEGEAWCRSRTTYPIACPDGVTRCINFPNWRWMMWDMPFDHHAFTTGCFAPYVHNAWHFAQVLAASTDVTSVMAEQLLTTIQRQHFRPDYGQTANRNPPPDFWDAWLDVPRPSGWRRGGLRGFFWDAARIRVPLAAEVALQKFHAAREQQKSTGQ